MKNMEFHWENDVPMNSFVLIQWQLALLHGGGLVHGDVHLPNMLSVGVLIDFEFAGIAGTTRYPRGLQKVNPDSKRHNDVEKAINPDDDDAIIKLSI